MRVVNIHHHDLLNPGDMASAPGRYFDFGAEARILGLKGLDLKELVDSHLVVGGGGLLGNAFYREEIANALRAAGGRKVLWGAGTNEHCYPIRFHRNVDGWNGFKNEVRGFLNRRGWRGPSTWGRGLRDLGPLDPGELSCFDLAGVRDAESGQLWVPCVSCMHGALDEFRSVVPRHSVVVVDHPVFFGINTQRWPKLENLNASMEQVLSFLASGEVVVTSSYHAAYWGILLGRRVVIVPWSSKFLTFPWPVELAVDLDGLRYAISRAKAFPSALEESRAANLDFAERVGLLFGTEVCVRRMD